ncbi:MAG: autotransporter outer membrane beta-barrel domain-containing protein [Schwartzia sp.]|nr:autotransporter outer membrane beta-barrel domain-containing protein [Schwartzia sp. (in: firmicutes)]
MSRKVSSEETRVRGGDERPAADSSFVSRFGGTLKGRKARAALALAVSLWMAGGGIVSAGQSTTINEDHEVPVYGNHVNGDKQTIDPAADTNGNTVTMTGGTVDGGVFGAYIENETSVQSATGNQVNVSGGTIEGNVLAGAAVYSGAGNNNVENNTVTVSGTAAIQVDIHGALTNNGTANNNHVLITGGNVNNNGSRRICGGRSNYGGDATNNTVTISGGTVNVGSIIGGCLDAFAGNDNLTGKATGNQVIINGASVKADIKGGWRMPAEYDASAAVTGNIVTLNGATVTGSVFGGYCNNDNYNGAVDIVTGNTLNLSGANTVSGMVKNFETINIKSAKWGTPALTLAGDGILANTGGGFPTINASELTFAKPETISTGGKTDLIQAAAAINANLAKDTTTQEYELNPVTGVMINAALKGGLAFNGAKTTLTYTATENKATKLTFGDVEWKDKGALIDHGATLTNVSFNGADVDTTNINFTNIKFLTANKKMTLVSSFGDTVGTITGTKYKVGSTLEGTGKASLVGNDLIFTAETSASQEQTHNTVMGAEVGMAALSAGNDFVGAATEGLSLASNVGADGVSSYAQMGGGSMRQETGSHVDTHTWNAILALGHANKKERGTMEYGAFLEYGTGNYTTHDGDERGDGSTRYTGGGVLAKWTANHGMYVEGSFRAGSVHDDARNLLRDADGNPFSYETNAPYMGFHLGVGKEIAFDDMHAVDVYGRYFYNRRNGVSFDAGGHYDLDAVTSQTIRVGARYIVKRDKWNFYGGLAYEHELDGKAAGKADGVEIRGADTSGASLRGELGATMKPGENSPWSLDLNVSGFAGKKQGFTGGVSVAFMF